MASETLQQPETATLPLNIAILTFGTRGDIQPYINLTKHLNAHGHSVRLTVPPALESWARDTHNVSTWNHRHDMGKFTRWGLYTPRQKLMAMVNGEFRRLKGQMTELFVEHWRASVDEKTGQKGPDGERPWVADVLIASPPGMTHVNIAQRLGVPLFLTHFNPKTITKEWPHGESYPSDKVFVPCDENRESWIKGDNKTWKYYFKGNINKVRKRHLDLPPLKNDFWPERFWDLNIPMTYLISPHVLPRPSDFPVHNKYAGFTFLDETTGYTPDPTLVESLSKPGPVIFVDFGSNEWLDRRGLTATIVKACEGVQARAVFRKAWYTADAVPSHVFVTDSLPHAWVFPKVNLVLHSGGAGATAISLKSGIPSALIPFRGDQYLWSKAIERLGAAPPALNIRDLTEAKLTTMLKEALDPKYKLVAEKTAEAMKTEPDGAEVVVKLLHEHLTEIDGYPQRCSLLPDRQAVWTIKGSPSIRLSALAAHHLNAHKVVSYDKLDLLKVVDWNKHASLRPWQSGHSRPNDIVRKQRIAQGAFDVKEGEALAEEVVQRWKGLDSAKSYMDK